MSAQIDSGPVSVTGVRTKSRPSLRKEKSMLREGPRYLAGCDEVGRGALAGPVSVGVVVIDAGVGRVPAGLADSKLLTAARREALVPVIRRWCVASAVGHAGPDEIDTWGLTRALGLAGQRALAALRIGPDVLLLDGCYDWLTQRSSDAVLTPPVVTQIKADVSCASVAAASVLAKTTRDAIMVGLSASHPYFGWDENKGYGSDHHREQLRAHGPCSHHRKSWRLGDTVADSSRLVHDLPAFERR